jgi:hypothetical protein
MDKKFLGQNEIYSDLMSWPTLEQFLGGLFKICSNGSEILNIFRTGSEKS